MVGTVLAVTSVYSAYQGYQQRKQQRKAQKEQLALQRQQNEEAKKRRKEAADRADIQMNKANRKRANIDALSAKEEQAALTGPAGTLLTGNQGVDPNKLNLGGNTLLGG
tara:strand:+ start:198 stop:524 length:327 start_codon:yes stop_codon:yes gene_type:complete